MKKILFNRNKLLYLFLIIFTMVLCHSLNVPVQVMYKPVSCIERICTPSENTDVPQSMRLKTYHSNLIEHDPISISSNNQFIIQGFPGSGTIDDPYLIEGFSITASSESLISISGTTAYFCVRSNILNGLNFAPEGIHFYNVSNGIISNNTVYNIDGGGITVDSSNQILIGNNTVSNCNDGGISTGYSQNNTIINNTVSGCGGHGALGIGETKEVYVYNNTVKFNTDQGLFIGSTQKTVIGYNRVFENMGSGMSIVGSPNIVCIGNFVHDNGWGIRARSDSCVFKRNVIYNNGGYGIDFGGSNSILAGNDIYDNFGSGISLEYSSNYNNISSNNLTNSSYYGLVLSSLTSFNTIIWNNFVENSGGDSQALNEGYINNIFAFNHWSDWTGPDIDVDGIVDNPYGIGGGEDSYPLTSQYPSAVVDILTSPALLTPNGGEVYTLTEDIQWLPAIDSKGHVVTYSISISADNGLTWELLASGLNTTNYLWNTSSVADGSTYLIKVITNCSEGETAEDTSNGIFTIHNYLSSPTILSPNGGEIINGTIPIQWSASPDSVGHDVTYTVYYSIDDGNTWILIDSSLNTPSLNWDTSGLRVGENFTIKVVATCTEGLTADDVSDGLFMVHYITPPTILTSFGSDPLKGTVSLQWALSTDSLGQDVTYSVFYSSNNGSSWIPVVSGLNMTNYVWNTTNVPDSASSLIKITASCSAGLISEDIYSSTFSVHNELSKPIILSPNGGEILNGTIPIQWSVSSDSLNHDVTYTVYYSSDGGNTWNSLVSSLDVSSYDWDTSVLATGTNFTIKVIATCSEGLTAVDLSDGSFMIHYITAPIISTSFGEESLKGMVTIQWAASTDSLGQEVTYSLYYSPDDGSTWIPIVSDLTTTTYTWNTTTVPDGANYKIKVVTTSSDGLTSENILGEVFSVHNTPPPPPDFSLFIVGLALIPIIPEVYFGRRLSKALSRKSEEGVSQI
ncbi:MAG: right-handed parallel beta-helix repeat-containing protein [Candidatus Heimdallarchaeota archaeon]|nr:MAG: right-handed parallel beta-helix repeat-containing protein [Candidatus Heimdallarchaeota archaeon]